MASLRIGSLLVRQEGKMSWYSDGEKFNEYDPPWCVNCTRGNSYEECKRCSEMHTERYSEDDD